MDIVQYGESLKMTKAMKYDSPHIKLFTTCTGHYFYDVNRNSIIKVLADDYKLLEEIVVDGFDEVIERYGRNLRSSIDILQRDGYLKCKRPINIRHKYIDLVDNYLNQKVQTAVLQVTQACNFKCIYCDYADFECKLDRNHSNEKMTWETAKNAIDFLLKKTTKLQDLH